MRALLDASHVHHRTAREWLRREGSAKAESDENLN